MTLNAVIVTVLLAGSAGAQDKHENHMHSFAKDVDALHAVLAPLWHAPAGKERSHRVCTQTETLEALTREIQGADTKPLLASLAALKKQCQSNPGKIDVAFSRVHEAFHHLAEPGQH
ncbi:MAG: hypothetical protein WCI19_10665 [Betaproteobacteria bacterium]|nr:hypothetical protein [Rhodocyclales bacterium]